MRHMNPYQKFVSDFAKFAAKGKKLPLGGIPPQKRNPPKPGAPAALIFSPHPDDECVIGGLPLRFMREASMRIVNVAVTLGSKKDRRTARLTELKAACGWIGFELEPTGLEKISSSTRTKQPRAWKAAVKVISN